MPLSPEYRNTLRDKNREIRRFRDGLAIMVQEEEHLTKRDVGLLADLFRSMKAVDRCARRLLTQRSGGD